MIRTVWLAAAFLREGCIAIEKALTDPAARAKLGEELAARYQELLDDRARWIACIYGERSVAWFSGPAWQAMSEKLFDATAEVAAKVGGRTRGSERSEAMP